jgi:high affinity sulfate transporter 1
MAGLLIAAVSLPQAMAYAQTAGLPVQAGLYGMILPVVAFAFLTSSRVVMTGPTTTTALMVAPALAVLNPDPAEYPALAAMLALLVGLVLFLARLLHLGWIADFISTPVLLGFVTGLALTMIAGQIGVLLGVPVSGGSPLQQYTSFFGGLFEAHGPTMLVGLGSLGLLVLGGRLFPKFPTLLMITVAAIAVSWVADLQARGVTVTGAIPAGLPPLSFPTVDPEDLLILVPEAIGIALLGFADAVLTARGLAARGDRPIDADQELLALAGHNAVAGLSGSFPLGASGSRSKVAVRLGGRTQVTALVQAGVILVALLVLTPALALLPKAMLAAVIIYSALALLDPPAWRALAHGSRVELGIASMTVLGMLTVGLLPALIFAVLLSVLDVARRSAEPRDAVLGWSRRHRRFVDVARNPDALLVPGVVVYRLDDRLFFANARYFTARVEEAVRASPTPVQVLVFDAEAVTHLDASAASELSSVILGLRLRGIRFVAARVRAEVQSSLEPFGLAGLLPEDSQFPTVRLAVLETTGIDVDQATR